MGNKWLVTLSGDNTDLEELVKTCTTPGLSVVKRNGEFFLESSSLTDADTALSVSGKATEIVSQLNGACRLALSSITPLNYTLHELKEDGSKVTHLTGKFVTAARATIGMEVLRADGTVEVISQADPVPLWMSLARSDPKVATVLDLLSVADWSSWVSLYRIFEVVESDMGGGKTGRQAIVSQSWASSDDIVRFRYTANSFNELGKEARHGDEAATHHPNPQPVPMTSSEARTLIERILHNWLRAKGGKP
jgi:hypothetical protein